MLLERLHGRAPRLKASVRDAELLLRERFGALVLEVALQIEATAEQLCGGEEGGDCFSGRIVSPGTLAPLSFEMNMMEDGEKNLSFNLWVERSLARPYVETLPQTVGVSLEQLHGEGRVVDGPASP